MLKAIFTFFTIPFSLPTSPIVSFLAMLVIGEIAYRLSYYKVGELYGRNLINSRTIGSVLHWIIRAGFYIAIWALVSIVMIVFMYWGSNLELTLAILAIAGVTIGVIILIKLLSRKKVSQ
ncbi:MAG: hypothetical protein ACI4KM_10710 [Oscillospiraceae bacterium]